MTWTSSFRRALVATLLLGGGTALAEAPPVTGKCVENNCGDYCGCQTYCTCSTHSSSSRPPTAEEIERARRFWGDGSAYRVDRAQLPSFFDLLRGKGDAPRDRRAARRSWTRPDALTALAGNDALGHGNWALAETNYRLAIAAGAADPSTWEALGFALLKQGKLDDAFGVLEIAQRSSRRDRRAARLLATALDEQAEARFKAGDFAGAEGLWRRALALDPSDRPAKDNLPRCTLYLSQVHLASESHALPDVEWKSPVARPHFTGATGQAADAAAEARTAASTGGDEEAKYRASLVFDTPLKGAVIVALPAAPIQTPAASPSAESAVISPSTESAAAPASDSSIVRTETRLASQIAAIDVERRAVAAEVPSPQRDGALAALDTKRERLEEERSTVSTIAAVLHAQTTTQVSPSTGLIAAAGRPVDDCAALQRKITGLEAHLGPIDEALVRARRQWGASREDARKAHRAVDETLRKKALETLREKEKEARSMIDSLLDPADREFVSALRENLEATRERFEKLEKVLDEVDRPGGSRRIAEILADTGDIEVRLRELSEALEPAALAAAAKNAAEEKALATLLELAGPEAKEGFDLAKEALDFAQELADEAISNATLLEAKRNLEFMDYARKRIDGEILESRTKLDEMTRTGGCR